MGDSTNKRAVSKIGGAILLSLSLAACGTNQTVAAMDMSGPSEGPALWTMQDDDTVIHLFGTAPVLPPETEWRSEIFNNAFADADIVVLESNGTAPEVQASIQQAVMQLGLNTDGRSLSSRLTPAEQAEVDAVTTPLGAPLQALDSLKPWLASVQVGVLNVSSAGYDLENTPAMIAALAAASEIPIRYLEAPTDLLMAMAGFSEDAQTGLFLHSIRTMRDNPDQTENLIAAWLAGDVAAVGDVLHGPGAWSSDVVRTAMLVERNNTWTARIADMMERETGTIFVAVGLGHLAGEDSLVGMLEDAGYTLTRR